MPLDDGDFRYTELVKRRKKKPKLGSGARFKALKEELRGRGVRDPGALAAHIGRKKYGAKKFASLGRKMKNC